jgi:hypothetical protein
MADMSPLARARDDIARIRAVLETARNLTEENRPVDLAAIGRRLAALCETVEAMPREDGQILMPALESLIVDLDGLAAVMTDRFGGLPTLGELANTKDAAVAYAVASKHFP